MNNQLMTALVLVRLENRLPDVLCDSYGYIYYIILYIITALIKKKKKNCKRFNINIRQIDVQPLNRRI